MPFTKWMANALLTQMKTGSGGPTFPYGMYLALFRDNPTSAGTAAYELTQTGYARIKVDTYMATGTLGFANNGSTISFASAGASWGKPTYWGIFTDATSPTLAVYDAIAGAVTINPGDVFNVHPGNLTLDFVS